MICGSKGGVAVQLDSKIKDWLRLAVCGECCFATHTVTMITAGSRLMELGCGLRVLKGDYS